MIAPSVAGQFPGTIYQLKTAIVQSGFDDVYEVAQGADITANTEAKEFVERYGIQGLTYTNGDGAKETGVFGVVVESGENFRVLPVQVQQSIFGFAVAGLD